MRREMSFCILLGLVLASGLGYGQQAAYPTPKDTIPPDVLNQQASRHGGAAFPKDWVISPACPLVVRQNHRDGPSYQEALGYTFLIHSMKRPRLVRLDSGRLVMFATAWLDKNNEEKTILLTSDNEGKSWSQPRRIGIYGQLVKLGGNKVAAIGSRCHFSDDGGETWYESPHKLPPFRGEVQEAAGATDNESGLVGWSIGEHGSVAFDGKRLAAISYYQGPSHGPVGWTAYSVLRTSDDLGRSWSKAIPLPSEWQTSEGAATFARDGALVAALRTAQPEGYPSYCDHWRRITTARSTDGGKTWTHHQVHFKYGKTHSELLTLANGDILLTYAVRMGDLDGFLYHGIEAVLSHDNGKTWGWDSRFILFRWPMHQTMHSPVSVQLSDGRILTVFLYTYDAPWGKGAIGLENLGLCNALFWNPYPPKER